MEFKTLDLGLIDFHKAQDIQKKNFLDVKSGRVKSVLILCRHHPVITLGRQADKKNILISPKELKKRGIPVYEIERGGSVTYHGPGQIIAYPIFDLNYFKKDIHLFLRALERVAVSLFADFQIKAVTLPGLTGVWINNKKAASIGIAIRNWITFHGLSINIKKNDLFNFHLIRPCGMDIAVTSLEKALNKYTEIEAVKEKIIHNFREVFN
ncbi:MAG: lipoyl(octanoyl) transferase LipB [Candidatus Omnitrophica bacterium]|nr:lipoyl(octanoyl) transferase LipB [Candidatus Omnitrophota bacterium]